MVFEYSIFVGPVDLFPMRRDLIASGISATKYNSVLYDAAPIQDLGSMLMMKIQQNIFAKMMEDVTGLYRE